MVQLSVIRGTGRAADTQTARPSARDGLKQLLLPLDRIRANPDNPRRVFDERALDVLAESIKHWGQLQPVVVRPVEDGYELVCGERRWRAHQRAQMPTIWAVEADVSKPDSLALALVENLQRVGLSYVEKVAALDQLSELAQAFGLRKTAAQLGVDPSWLSRQISVRKDPVIFPALEAGDIGFGQAAELLRAPMAVRRTLLQRTVQSARPVRTAAIRAWVESARREAQSFEQHPSAYWKLLDKLVQLGTPRSTDDRTALTEIAQRIERLLAESIFVEQPTAPPAEPRKHTYLELSCLVCGEEIEVVLEGQEMRPLDESAVRHEGRHLMCGRCGGKLTAGEQREEYFYTF